MNIKSLVISLSTLFLAVAGISESALIVVNTPGVVFTNRQPVQAVVVDCNGVSVQQTVYYDAALGGFDVAPSCMGDNASVYFPTLSVGYIAHNGFWVGEDGGYWSNGRRLYVDRAVWGDHWHGYWNAHGGYYRGGGGFHEGYHEAGFREGHRDEGREFHHSEGEHGHHEGGHDHRR